MLTESNIILWAQAQSVKTGTNVPQVKRVSFSFNLIFGETGGE